MKIDPETKEELKRLVKERLNVINKRVTVVTSYPVNEDDKQYLFSHMNAVLKNSHVDFEIDSDILGGILIKTGSKVIDLSLKRQLLNLKKVLYESA